MIVTEEHSGEDLKDLLKSIFYLEDGWSIDLDEGDLFDCLRFDSLRKLRDFAEENKVEMWGFPSLVKEDGGCEGEGDRGVAVILIDGDYYSFDWTYASHYGPSYDFSYQSVKKVKPTIKQVIVYE